MRVTTTQTDIAQLIRNTSLIPLHLSTGLHDTVVVKNRAIRPLLMPRMLSTVSDELK